jgi:Mlc titration factor MtfA (ptsG expression regulator)
LAWDAVLASDAHPGAGHDVVLHEFAHQLDAQDGAMDGTPELDTPARYAAWTQIATAEFAALHAALAQHVPPTLDPYGATNPAEFFATSVEAFFETPERLAHQHAKLYAELAAFFHFDPVARLTAHDTAR